MITTVLLFHRWLYLNILVTEELYRNSLPKDQDNDISRSYRDR